MRRAVPRVLALLVLLLLQSKVFLGVCWGLGRLRMR